MAKRIYRHVHTLTCEFCGKTFQSGRKNRFCSRRCQMRANNKKHPTKRLGVRTFVCDRCGKSFEAKHKRRFCCIQCRLKTYEEKQRGGLLPQPIKHARRGICLQCGKLTGTRWTKFCSRECAFEYDRIESEYLRHEREMLRAIQAFKKAALKPVERLLRVMRKVRNLKRREEKTRKRVAVCQVCGREIRYQTCPRKYCSKECLRKSEMFKRGRRMCKAKRRARQRALPYQSIDPIEVFERDGWLCKSCGIPTPREKRGTCEPDAPELDHIKPLSKGGHHVWQNVQCLCRQCNQLKGDSEG